MGKIDQITNGLDAATARSRINEAVKSGDIQTSDFAATAFIDDDTFASALSTNIPSAESVKAYVDTATGANTNVVIVTQESDFPSPSGGIITLDSSTVYQIAGDVVITNKIDANGAVLLGRDRTFDKITSTQASSEIFTGNGQVVARNLTFAITGASSKIFNLLGTTGFEYVYIQDCTFAASTATGTIENYYAVQFVNVPNQNPSGGLTLTDVFNISLRGFDTSIGHSASTVLTIAGDTNLVQIFFCGFGVAGGQTALDISSVSLYTYGEITSGSGFSGAGTYVNGSFNNLWLVDARGLNEVSDEVAIGAFYVSSSAQTTISTINTPVKVAGTTTLSGSEFRVDDDSGTNNRLRYTGTKTRTFQITASISTTSPTSNVNFTWYIAKNGTVNANSGIQRKQGTGSDVGALAISWIEELSTNDYLELWVENNDGTSNVTAEKMTLLIS